MPLILSLMTNFRFRLKTVLMHIIIHLWLCIILYDQSNIALATNTRSRTLNDIFSELQKSNNRMLEKMNSHNKVSSLT